MKLSIVGLLLAALPLSHATTRGARVLPVKNVAEFQDAVARARPGDTIKLAHGSYVGLSVSRVFRGRVTVAGSRRAHLAGIAFANAANVKLTGVSIEPVGGQRVSVTLRNSQHITLDNVLVDGLSEKAGAWIDTDPTDSHVTIRDSELTNCGNGNRCIDPDAREMRIIGNDFHDCLDCDFIRDGENAGSNVMIVGNTFERAIPGGCNPVPKGCNHNDHIQIMGGGPWTIVGNRFGAEEGGAASVYVSTGVNNVGNRIHNVFIASNVFSHGGPSWTGIQISVGGAAGPPKHVSVVNNTILSGKATAILIAENWAGLPLSARPLVANNILAVSNGTTCVARTSTNLVERGHACRGDFTGPAKLDSAGAPTAASTLVLGRANPADIPKTDFYGRPLPSSRPDIGAVQSRPASTLTAPARLIVSRAELRGRAWVLRTAVRFRALVTLRTRLIVGHRAYVSSTSHVAGLARRTVVIPVPMRVRQVPRLKLAFRGTSPGRRTVAAATLVLLPK